MTDDQQDTPPEKRSTTETDTVAALTILIKTLTPLDSQQRQRVVDAAMTFLGEISRGRAAESRPSAPEGGLHENDDGYPPAVSKWMHQYEIHSAEIDQVFHFKEDGSFDIHSVPGKARPEQSRNTYILVGLGKFLTTGDRNFDDASARKFCETLGCYDATNHSKYLKDKGAYFSGDKNKGYSLTKVGEKHAASIVKEVANSKK